MSRNPLDAGYFDSVSLRAFGFGSVGENVRIAKTCNIVGAENIDIGNNVRIDAYTQIVALGARITLGSFIHVGAGCFLSGRGGIEMGDFSGLSQHVSIYSASDDYLGRHMTNPLVPEHLTGVTVARVSIGRHCIVGSGSVILPGVNLEEGVAVGALSLVTRTVPEWTLVSGIPARRAIKRHRDPLILEQELRDQLIPSKNRPRPERRAS
jgi:acetyltransferase-like isoleucine patch superfamily enzyme